MWKTIANETTCYSELFTTNDFTKQKNTRTKNTLAGLGSCRSCHGPAMVHQPRPPSLVHQLQWKSVYNNTSQRSLLAARVHSQGVQVTSSCYRRVLLGHTWPMSLETSWAARLGSNDLGSSQRPHWLNQERDSAFTRRATIWWGDTTFI